MKPALIRIRHNNSSVDFDDREYSFFYNPWHYHPELELTLILESYGQRLVGDSIENFAAGDLVLLGSNLPHVWKNDKCFFEENNQSKARAIVIKFLPDFAGKDLINMEEMKSIRCLMHDISALGIRLTGNLKILITKLMHQMGEMDDAERIIHLLKMLYHISISTEYVSLASLAYKKDTTTTNERDNLRINTILDYLIKKHHEQIELEEVAKLIHMNKNAFCRFFKQKTGKSMIALLSEIRIGQACQRLQKTEESVDMVSNFVGFNNISNFNRAFKVITGTTPLVYRKKIKDLELKLN
jgi:AraC-like DNA-binding protein